jgi:hypothetical protein
VEVRLRAPGVLDDAREELGAVDEQLDAVARARREGAALGPAAGRSIGGTVAVAGEPAPMVRGDEALDGVAEHIVDPVERERRDHG